MLEKVSAHLEKPAIQHEKMNASLSNSAELFSRDALKSAAEKSSRVLYDETIRKVMLMDDP